MQTIQPFLRSRLQNVIIAGCVVALTAVQAVAADYEWGFNSGDLSTTLGNGIMAYADAATPGLTSFGTTDGGTVPHIGGNPAKYMHVPAFSATANGYHLTLNDTGPNGGGAYVNRYTVIFDVLSPGTINWTPFFNTDPANGNDADFYVASDGAIGIGALGYSGVGLVAANTWYRVAFAADLGAGTVSYYLNGTSVKDRVGTSLLDGRFSLYSNLDAGPDLLLFNEGDTTGQYTHELYVNSVAFVDRMMSSSEILALGGPNAQGIFPVPEPSVAGLVALGLMVVALGVRRKNSARA